MVTYLTDEELREQQLDICEKYKRDLDFLKNGRDKIETSLSHSGLDNEVISKKLRKLNRSIDTMEHLIDEFEHRRLESPNDERFIYIDENTEEVGENAELTD